MWTLSGMASTQFMVTIVVLLYWAAGASSNSFDDVYDDDINQNEDNMQDPQDNIPYLYQNRRYFKDHDENRYLDNDDEDDDDLDGGDGDDETSQRDELLEEIKLLKEKLVQKRKQEKYGSQVYAKKWLIEYNNKAADIDNMVANANWNYNVDITDQHAKEVERVSLISAEFSTKARNIAKQFKIHSFSDPNIKRQLKLICSSAICSHKRINKKLAEIQSQMQTLYSTSKACNKTLNETKCYNLEPDLLGLMAKSRDYYKLQWAWKAWRDATGPKIGKLYPQFVELLNAGAKENGYSDVGEYWRESYEIDNDQLPKMVDKLWKEVKPMYQQLHAYVRQKLILKYPGKISPTGYIPAHLLGNMWAQIWSNILDVVMPYPNVTTPDVTPEMVKQNYTPLKMFKTAEHFFTSIGLSKMTEDFWNKSMIEKPKNRKAVCHGSAEDFHNGHDFRIKMCTKTNMEYFYVIHHEMGHVEYYMQYAGQPNIYRTGANPGFHEAIGDTIALSVETPEHFKKIKLMSSSSEPDKETRHKMDINFLMKMALEKIAFLPFGLLIDKWRWDVFSSKTKPEHYNQQWWTLRKHYQGIEPPPGVIRTSKDFDPGAKFHVPDNTPYIRYFFSFLLQFQFHKALCKEAGFQGQLHHCDIYQSTKAGQKLKTMLSLGASQRWPVALHQLTGSDTVQTSAIKEFFEPLMQWLREQNKDQTIGWDQR